MRISDWSSDVCSSDLSARSWARASRGAACAFRCRRSSRSGFLDEGDMIGAPGAGPDLGARRAQPADLAEGDVAGDEQRPVAGILAGRRGGAEHAVHAKAGLAGRSEEHTSELQSLMRLSYAVFC